MTKPRLGPNSLHLLEKLDNLSTPVNKPATAAVISGLVMDSGTALATLRRLEQRGFVAIHQRKGSTLWAYGSTWQITAAGSEALHAHYAPYRVTGAA